MLDFLREDVYLEKHRTTRYQSYPTSRHPSRDFRGVLWPHPVEHAYCDFDRAQNG